MNFDWLKTTAFISGKVQEIQQKMLEIKKLIGEGEIDIKVEAKSEILIRIIITNPTDDLEQLAENILLILPNVQVRGVKVTIELEKGEQRLIRNVQ